MSKLKYIVILLLLLLFFFAVEINLLGVIDILPFEILIFAVVSEILLFRPVFKLVFIVFANMLFLLMALLFVLNLVEIANIFGSLGFGILIITAFFYLPQLFKYGHIEKF